MFYEFFTHTNTLIFAPDCKNCLIIFQDIFSSPYCNRTVHRTEFNRIIHYACQNSSEIYWISKQNWISNTAFFPINFQSNFFFYCFLIIDSKDFPHHVCAIKNDFLAFEISTLNLVHIQHIIYQRYQILQRLHHFISDFFQHLRILRMLFC